MTEQIALYGLLGLAVVTLLWSIYQSGKAAQKSTEAQEDITKAVEVERSNNELEKQSREAADRAIDAGAAAGPAPADPVSLPDSVRARIFGRRGK